MPARPDWLLRLPGIIDCLLSLSAPVVDRRTVERVFQLKRRRAIELMHELGSYRRGRHFVLDRDVLIRDLKRMRTGAEFLWEQRRQQRLSEEFDILRKHASLDRLFFLGFQPRKTIRLTHAPNGICVEPGRLTITFRRPEDLMEHLFALAQALVNDSEDSALSTCFR